MMSIKASDSQVSFSRFGPIPEARFEIVVKHKYHYYIWKIFVPSPDALSAKSLGLRIRHISRVAVRSRSS
jgi:hypothetical protein